MLNIGTEVMLELQSWVIYNWLPKEPATMADGFKSRDIGLRAQKKILSRMNKNMAKMFIDDTTASLLDNLYKLAKHHSSSKKEAEKLIKNIIKVVIKIGVLYKNNQFSAEELTSGDGVRKTLHAVAMSVVSFHQVEFSYERQFLRAQLEACRQHVKALVARHLTPKSLNRVDLVFDFFTDADFLDAAFTQPDYRPILDALVEDLHTAIDEGGM